MGVLPGVVGHDVVARQLASTVPPVVLLRGPRSVGKRTMAEAVGARLGIPSINCWAFTQLSADAAREIRHRAGLRAESGSLFILPLDDASPAALNALLKLLEEPPAKCWFFLTAVGTVPATIMSRARVFRLGYLSDEHLERILVDRLGFDSEAAKRMAGWSQGSVADAVQYATYEPPKAPVLSYLQAIASGDVMRLEAAARVFDEERLALLVSWCVERIGRNRIFTEAEHFGLTSQDASALLRKIARPGRPVLLARLAGESMLRLKHG